MLAFVMMTKNSGRHVEKVLKQAGLYADMRYVLVDAGSTDDTLEICRDNAEHVETIHSAGYIEPHLPYLYSLPDTEWVIRLDDDELLGERFFEQHQEWMGTSASAVWMPRYNVMPQQRYLSNHPMYPDYQLRMFRKGKITPRTLIHNSPDIHGTVITVNAHILHMKYLWRTRQEREELQRHYDQIEKGGGSGVYAPHQLPEFYYKGVIGTCEEWIGGEDGKTNG